MDSHPSSSTKASSLLVAAFSRRTPKIRYCFALLVVIPALHLVLNLSTTPRLWPARTFQRKVPVTLLVVSDQEHHVQYASQARSIACYAKAHGYEFAALVPSIHAPVCLAYRLIQFQKPCTIGQWLLSQPENAQAVVFDGDVIGGTANISLQRWLDSPYNLTYDLAFYERSWNFEVMSGNFIVRNTPFTRLFLNHWASFDLVLPRGYAATDNGAIHLAILDALALRGRHICYDLYRALEADVRNLFPYFEFVACTKALLGPPRVYVAMKPTHLRSNGSRITESSDVAGRIVIFPRLFGFAVDSKVHGFVGVNQLHPFHHEWKSEKWKDEYMDSENRGMNTGCRPFSAKNELSEEEMGKKLKDSDNYWVKRIHDPFSLVPRWLPLNESCYEKLWCPPLPPNPTSWPTGFIERNGQLVEYEFKEPAVDFHNLFLSGLYARNE